MNENAKAGASAPAGERHDRTGGTNGRVPINGTTRGQMMAASKLTSTSATNRISNSYGGERAATHRANKPISFHPYEQVSAG